jgi:hypothetical protein
MVFNFIGDMILFGFLVIAIPSFLLLSRYATRRTIRQGKKDGDDLTRKTLSLETDYRILWIAKMDDEMNKGFGPRFRELAREEALRRGLDHNKPIDPSVKGYPVAVEKPVQVKSFYRRRPRRRA